MNWLRIECIGGICGNADNLQSSITAVLIIAGLQKTVYHGITF
jgi:hypothetical protein